jgi:hypothetical protein
MLYVTANDCPAIYRLAVGSQLRKAVKQQTPGLGCAAVKPECKLIEIVGEMLRAYCSLMYTKPPPIKLGCDTMDTRHDNVGRVSASPYIDRDMTIAQFAESAVASPSIASDFRSFFHAFGYEAMKAVRRNVWNNGHAYPAHAPASNFHRDRNDRFSPSPPPAHPCCNATDIGFINLNRSGQPVPPRTNHCPAQFVEPIPGRIIAPNTKNPLQSQSAGSIFLTGYKPHGEKPGAQRFMCAMKQSSRSNGRLSLAFHAQVNPTFHQGRGLRMEAAVGTAKTIWPSEFTDIPKASILIAKPFVELLKCGRIVNSAYRLRWSFHARTLHVVAG